MRNAVTVYVLTQVALLASLRYALPMETISLDATVAFVKALWPLWLVLAVCWAVAFDWGGSDRYEDPKPVQPSDKWMTVEERKYHGDNSHGR